MVGPWKSRIVLSLGLLVCFIGVLQAQEYEPINSPVSSASSSSAASPQSQYRSGSYYSDPKSAQYYYPAESYSYGNTYGGNALKRDSQPEYAATSYGGEDEKGNTKTLLATKDTGLLLLTSKLICDSSQVKPMGYTV
jgi:hypothetical protein